MIYNSITQLVGGTPLIELTKYNKQHNCAARIAVKLESMNPAGSAKDRVGLAMIRDAVRRGDLQPGGTIFEPTSGNTGIGLAMCAAALGFKLVLTMPDTMSVERQLMVKAYGAEVVLTPGSLGMQGAIDKAEELHSRTPGSIIAGQFVNPINPQVHYETTGPEIWADTDGTVDIFVAGVGTGGTISGVGRYLKEQRADVRVYAVEPANSAVLSGKSAGPHGLQGIGAGFVPQILDIHSYDGIMTITDEQAYSAGRELARTEGIFCGITSGASLAAATELAQRSENDGKLIVALLPDSGDRYLSTPLYNE
ncbi:MAG: cysteine synthase A [Spirochaetales bacterium]|nr:cysteine synthase A [Spirochaetales bacterium]